MICITWEQLVDYVEGKLASDECPKIVEHLERCANCASEVTWLQQTLGLLKEDLFPAPPLSKQQAVIEAFHERLPFSSSNAPPSKARQAVLDAFDTFEKRIPRQAPSPAPEPKRAWYKLKLPRFQWAVAFAFATILIIALFWRQAQPSPFSATITQIDGIAQISQAGKTPQRLTTDLTLSVGDYLTTDEESEVTLAFGDTKVTLFANSRLGIEQIKLNHSQLSLLVMETDEAGSIEITTQNAGEIKLDTAHGTVSTHDGTFRVRYLTSDEIIVTVIRGKVHISNAHGAIDLEAGKEILLYEELPPGE